MALIDIGTAAINRPEIWSSGFTIIAEENPANATGKITSIEIWANVNLANCEVATFYKTNRKTFTTRATEAIGTVVAGAKRTFPVTLQVVAGDYIGIYFTSGKLDDTYGGVGSWYKEGDYIPCTGVAFGHYTDDTISLYGTGTTEVLHEWEGSDDIAIGEALVKTPMKMLVDGFKFSDVTIKEFYKVLTDPIAFTDVWTGYKLRVFEFIDGIKIGEALVKTTSKVISDGIKFTDTLVKHFEKVISDDIAIAEVLRKDITKVFTDGIAFRDIVTKFFERVFTDGIAFTDCLTRWRWVTAIRNLTKRRCVQPSIREQNSVDDGNI